MEEPRVILNKDGVKFIKLSKNNFQLLSNLENSKLDLVELINFDLIKLMYDLNKDINEYTDLYKINEQEAIMIVLMKPFFEDLGFPQKYAHLRIHKIVEENKIKFISIPIIERPEQIPKHAEMIPFKTISSTFYIENIHKISIENNITFQDKHVIPPFIEKFFGTIFCKIYNRVKLFIDKA